MSFPRCLIAARGRNAIAAADYFLLSRSFIRAAATPRSFDEPAFNDEGHTVRHQRRPYAGVNSWSAGDQHGGAPDLIGCILLRTE
jgi:hypothetical protein